MSLDNPTQTPGTGGGTVTIAKGPYDFLQDDVNTLAANPSNIPLRTKILRTQVQLTAGTLNISQTEGANVVRSFTAGYAQNKGIDPKAILDALTTEEQNILNYSKSNPTLYGVSLSTANQIAGLLGVAAGILTTISMGLVIFALFTIGPEIFAAFEGISSIAGVLSAITGSPIIAGATITFIMGEVFGHFATNIPMLTKQMIDNGSIGPGLRISALTDAEKLTQQLNGTAAPGSFTSAQFKSYAKAIESAGVTAINDPNTKTQIPYSQGALANLIIFVTGQQTLAGNKTTFTAVKNMLSQYLVSSQGSSAVTKATADVAAIPAPNTAVTITVTPITKVFTGIVSQGVVSDTLTFEPRPSDLISSLDDLRSAASNNLAPFLNTLLGKIVYEVKVVSSVITKDGFKQSGTVQKVQTGVTKAGKPTYKTVVNKFAELVVFALTDKGSRAKLTTIVLGPVDSAKLIVGQNDLQTLQDALPDIVTTTDISQVSNITAPTATPATTPKTATPTPVSTPVPAPVASQATKTITKSGGTTLEQIATQYSTTVAILEQLNNPTNPASLHASSYIANTYSVIVPISTTQPSTGSAVSGASPTATPVKVPTGLGATATTLYDWYTAHGWALPSTEVRATLYADFNLGSASYYTGTAEQNTKLLAALKQQQG